MALFKHGSFLQQSLDPAFDRHFAPGTPAPFPGIFKCISCGDEIAIAGGHILPPQNHKQHNPVLGPVMWQLVIFPISK